MNFKRYGINQDIIQFAIEHNIKTLYYDPIRSSILTKSLDKERSKINVIKLLPTFDNIQYSFIDEYNTLNVITKTSDSKQFIKLIENYKLI